MSELKCPYCNKTLHCGATIKSDKYLIDLYQCANPECESTEFLVGCKEFWDILGQLIRTRKALDVAVDALKDNLSQANFTQMLDASRFHCIRTKCESALEQITAQEQKD